MRWLVGSLAVVLAACSSGPTANGGSTERLRERLEVVGAHVAEWAGAGTIEEAHAAAEAAANHVAGPDGPYFGDRDADGEMRGPSDAGILPGLEGANPGFALQAVEAGGPVCIIETVLGGDWSDPAGRWAQVDDVLARWSPAANTMPELASHPHRIVGWATLTLGTVSLEEAHEYAGHARLHVDVSLDALEC